MSKLENINIASFQPLTSPAEFKRQQPADERAARTVIEARRAVRDILRRKSPRLLAVVGPCSIHNVDQTLEFARRLRGLADQVDDTLLLVMRVYFEKPRTTVGWKGMINDPRMDDSFRIEEGLHRARELLIELAKMGLPAATEALDPIVPQYIHDLIAWTVIGARTAESQTHREMASGVSSPIGFKNSTDGSLAVAINALQSVSRPHRFLGIDAEGKVAVVETTGNPDAHIVLRGGSNGPNYDSRSVAKCARQLEHAGARPNIMIDCSHANSNKDHELQPLVVESVVRQILDGSSSIIGVMMESNLEAGKQNITQDLSKLRYGVSVTDACIDWPTTQRTLLEAREALRDVLPERLRASQPEVEVS